RRPHPRVVVGHVHDAGWREALGENPGLHRAVAKDSRMMRRAPGNELPRGVTVDERERWLQRIDVTDRLAAVEQRHVEVRDPDGANLPFLDKLHHRIPRVFDRRARLIRPVELVEIDALDAKSL